MTFIIFGLFISDVMCKINKKILRIFERDRDFCFETFTDKFTVPCHDVIDKFAH